MKIAILNFRNVGHPNKGGAEIYLEKLCQEWIEIGHEITFFSPKHRATNAAKYNNLITYWQVGNRFTTYFLVRRTIKKLDYDVIVDSVNVKGFNTPKIKWKNGTSPRIITIIYQTAEEIWDNQTRFPVSWLGKKFFEPRWLGVYRNSHVITISESSAESLKRFGLQKISVIHPGITVTNEIGKVVNKNYTRNIVLVFCARMVPMKRPLDALEILKILKQTNPEFNFNLNIIGTGPLLGKMKEIAEKEALPVKFFGSVEDKVRDEVFRESDFVLATSVREGWGMTITEAAAQGCIGIAYDVPGLRDSVKCANGYAALPSPLAVSELISSLINNQVKKTPSMNGGLRLWKDVAISILR
jgi:glycosyltransferase involved in cell wall biosynthesis